MFHKAIDLKFKRGTTLELTFQDGKVKQYDMALLFDKYPQLTALKNRKLFTSGKLSGYYGVIWNDELDIEAETVYESGWTVRNVKLPANVMVGNVVASARASKGFSQKELSDASGIDQSDISKIERGVANPSIGTLNRIAEALDSTLVISMAPHGQILFDTSE